MTTPEYDPDEEPPEELDWDTLEDPGLQEEADYDEELFAEAAEDYQRHGGP